MLAVYVGSDHVKLVFRYKQHAYDYREQVNIHPLALRSRFLLLRSLLTYIHISHLMLDLANDKVCIVSLLTIKVCRRDFDLCTGCKETIWLDR